MRLTKEAFRELLVEYTGVAFDEAAMEPLYAALERHLESMHELQALDLGGEDPRTTHYIRDMRLTK